MIMIASVLLKASNNLAEIITKGKNYYQDDIIKGE